MQFHSISEDFPIVSGLGILPKSTPEVYHLVNGLLREVSPARIFPSLVKGLGWLVSVPGSGGNIGDSFGTYDPATQSWKTSEPSLFEDLPMYWDRLPRSGMMRNGKIYGLPMSARPIAENESGLWPTPTKSDAKAHRNNPDVLASCWGKDYQQRVNYKYAHDFGMNPSSQVWGWLMGYPLNWSKLKDTAIVLSLKSPN